MGNRQLRTVLVGYGYWGTNILRNMFGCSNILPIAVVEKDPTARNRCQRLYPSILFFEELNDCLKQTKPDAVVVATAPDTHCELAAQALTQNCHVLIEKPMAMTLAECNKLIELGKKVNRQIMVDHTFLFHPPVSYLGRNIRSGQYGDLLYYDSVRVNLGGFQKTNVLWDLAPHDLAILDFFLGGQTPLRVSAVGAKHFGSSVETMVYVTLIYPNQFIAHLHLNWAAPVKGRQITIGATKKMIVYDDNTPVEKVRIYDKGVEVHSPTETDLRINYRIGDMVAPTILQKEALAEMLNEFSLSALENRASLSDAECGRRVVIILNALSESLAKNGSVVDLLPQDPRLLRAV